MKYLFVYLLRVIGSNLLRLINRGFIVSMNLKVNTTRRMNCLGEMRLEQTNLVESVAGSYCTNDHDYNEKDSAHDKTNQCSEEFERKGLHSAITG